MRYRVAHHLRRNGKEYGPGDSISLSEAEAKQCGSALQPWSEDEAAELAEKAKEKARKEEKEKESGSGADGSAGEGA